METPEDRSEMLDLGSLLPGLRVLPVRHGSLAFAEAARHAVLEHRYARIALDLPSCVSDEFCQAVERLPEIWAATWIQDERRWVLPADPCDACTMAARVALQERIPLVFVDDESPTELADDPDLPDPSTAETLGVAEYAGICLASLDRIATDELRLRAARMASRLRALPAGDTLLVVRLALLPSLLRELTQPSPDIPLEELAHPVSQLELLPVEPKHLLFALGEWPFVAQEAERLRADPFGQIPSSRQWTGRLLGWARRRLVERRRAARIPLSELKIAVRFAERLAKLSGQHQPSLWDVVQAARATSGDAFATSVLEAARFHGHEPMERARLKLGPFRAKTPDDQSRPWSHRLLPRPPRWAQVKLRREPEPEEARKWIKEWKPLSLCSHLPEDIAIERFNREIRERAKSRTTSNQPVSRPFESSLMDGLDMRETVRNFWKGEIWVKEFPPRELKLDAAVIAFDEGGPFDYPHRGTWYAEHQNESTLIFYATNPGDDPIGPGILRSRYGGLALLFPPRQVPDVFALDEPPLGARNALETLVAGACLFARQKAVAYAAWEPPSLALQSIAQQAGKRLVHVPLSTFPAATVDKLRTFHVLNGKDVRGWADRFIQG
jgi:hypothetical protein